MTALAQRRRLRSANQAALERDYHCCVLCGAAAEQVHHRQARGFGGSRDEQLVFGLANLLSLCQECHEYVERNPTLAYDSGLKVRRPTDPATVAVLLYDGLWFYLADGGRVAAEDVA